FAAVAGCGQGSLAVAELGYRIAAVHSGALSRPAADDATRSAARLRAVFDERLFALAHHGVGGVSGGVLPARQIYQARRHHFRFSRLTAFLLTHPLRSRAAGEAAESESASASTIRTRGSRGLALAGSG